ncbi:Vacuolar amino acid transporter 5 [Diplonema papillatum]|nr:Vacuolar amino acid transporter 5 [Diplonema papillatum]
MNRNIRDEEEVADPLESRGLLTDIQNGPKDYGAPLPAEVEGEEEQDPHHGTFAGTVFNILSNVVGGGVLSLPYAFANTGYVIGSIALLYVGLLSGFSMWILMTCSDRLHKNNEPDSFSYKAMMIRAYGPRMGKVVEAFIVWYTFGCCIAYASVVGSSLAPLAKDWVKLSGIWTSRITWTALGGVLFAITSSVRNLSELKFTSALAFITIVYVIVVVVIRLFDPEGGHDRLEGSAKAVRFGPQIFKAIPLFSVSFGCHYNIPVFYEDLRARTPGKMTRIIATSLGIIFVSYFVIAFAGYLHFGESVPSYILEFDGSESGSGSDEQFRSDDTLVNIGRLGMFAHFGFVFPLIAIACRRSINLFLNRDHELLSSIELALQSLAIVACAVGLAIATNNIGVILSFNGALFGVFIIVTFPGLLLLKLSKDPVIFPDPVPAFAPWMLIISGILFSVCGFVINLVDLVD